MPAVDACVVRTRSVLRGSYQRRQVAHIDRACAVCDLGTVPTDQALTLLEQRRERALELSGIERATPAVVLLGELSRFRRAVSRVSFIV